MSYPINVTISNVAPPPIADAQAWIRGREFPADKPLLDVAQAVPNYPPPPELTRHLAERAQESDTSFYTDIPGTPPLRAALAAHMSEGYRGKVAPDDVAITAGCNQAFCTVMTALAQAGDEVILPLPYYFNHEMWLSMQGIKCIAAPFDETAGVPDPAAIESLISPCTRAIALVTPDNPTGAVYSPELIRAIFELARANDIALVIDETYKDFRDNDDAPHALFQDPAWRDTFVQLYSFSKVYSLTGYRVGSVICGPTLMEAILKIQDCIAICAPAIGQEAARFGLEHLAQWRDDKRNLMKARMDAVRQAFKANDLRYELVSVGAYFAYVKHPFENHTSWQVAEALAARENILCLPGSMFGSGQDRYMRFAFANLEAEQMPELARRLVNSQSGLFE